MRTTAETSSSSEAARAGAMNTSAAISRHQMTGGRSRALRAFRMTASCLGNAESRTQSACYAWFFAGTTEFTRGHSEKLGLEQRQAVGGRRFRNRRQIDMDVGQIGIRQHHLAVRRHGAVGGA